MDWLADAVLIVHLLFAAFVVGGLGFIWVGTLRDWQAARNFRFRVLHLAAMLFVAAETLVGAVCPLTVLEDRLRGSRDDTGFVARWLQRILYYDFPGWVFLAAYLLFALMVIATFVLIPPHREHRRRR